MMGRRCGVLFIVLAGASLGLCVAGQRTLPPTERWPRNRADWEAKEAEAERLGGPTFKDAYPEHAQDFDAMIARQNGLKDVFLAPGFTMDIEHAGILIDELYVDHGHPVLNAVGQNYILDTFLGQMARWDEVRLPPPVREYLVRGLLEYFEAGGGQNQATMQAEFAVVLGELGRGHPAAQQVANTLLEDAIRWAQEVNFLNDYHVRLARRLWGDAAELRIYELTLPPGRLPLKVPKRYQEAVRRIRELLEDKASDEGKLVPGLREVWAALTDLSDRDLQDDLLCRLLLAYKVLLARKPAISEKAAEYIEERLARLVAGEQRLRGVRHWKLWGQAVVAAGERGPRKAGEPLRVGSVLREAVVRVVRDEAVPAGVREELKERFAVGESKPVP